MYLTDKLAVTADGECYMVGRPRQRAGRAVSVDNPRYYGHLCSALAYGVVMKLQNLLFVRSCVPDRVQPVERRNARTQKIEVHFNI